MKRKYFNKTRNEMAQEYFYGRGAEIGVEQGRFSEVICQNSPGVTLYCIDAWTPYEDYNDHRRATKLERYYRRTKKLLHKYGCTVIRRTSMDALTLFEDCTLDFVYIDANHSYNYVKEDINHWAQKVKPGGIVAGHDYKRIEDRSGFYDVIKAVNEYCDSRNIELIVYGKDEHPSWMFFKQ